MISFHDARDFVLGSVTALAPREIDLASARGGVLAEDVRAREASPRFDNSSMDGFALRARDTAGGGQRLRVSRTVFAGDGEVAPLGEGEAARIMTGAPVPAGADVGDLVKNWGPASAGARRQAQLRIRAGTGHGRAHVGGETACEADLLYVLVDRDA